MEMEKLTWSESSLKWWRDTVVMCGSASADSPPSISDRLALLLPSRSILPEFMPSVKHGLTKSPMGLNFKGPVKFSPTKLIAIFNSVSIALFWKHPQSSSSSSSCYFIEWTRSSPILQWPLLNSLSPFPLKPQSTRRLQFWNHLRLSLALRSSSPPLPNLETFQSFPGSPESDAKLITFVLYRHRPNRKNLRPVQLRRPSLISSMCFCQSPIATLFSPKEQDW